MSVKGRGEAKPACERCGHAWSWHTAREGCHVKGCWCHLPPPGSVKLKREGKTNG